MASNEYVNKVVFGNDTLIDLSADTVAADKVLSGYTAHGASGTPITGTIPTKTSADISLVNTTLTVDSGYYATNIQENIPGVTMTVPVSNTNDFYVELPDGQDSVRVLFSVDDEGNIDMDQDILDATGVNF